ncbi:hypothetical protein [Streptomyces sp. HC307]|uniref:hypothetical protein n=1 Tax=Streptomyces flavusporus TaxID=3385496 RepID=UPI0039174FFA
MKAAGIAQERVFGDVLITFPGAVCPTLAVGSLLYLISGLSAPGLRDHGGCPGLAVLPLAGVRSSRGRRERMRRL